jgi:hypothetical protein
MYEEGEPQRHRGAEKRRKEESDFNRRMNAKRRSIGTDSQLSPPFALFANFCSNLPLTVFFLSVSSVPLWFHFLLGNSIHFPNFAPLR